ncbi:MAG TPA: M28 family peptidase [Balneolaceae bacterium]
MMNLKLKSLFAVLIAVMVSCTGTQQSTQKATQPTTDTEALLSYQDEITVDYLRKHLSVIAADSMKGRETGSEGIKMAAEYLAKQYRKMGLEPVGDNDTYFQHYKLNATVTDSIVFQTSAIEGGEKTPVSRSVASENSTAKFIRAFGGTDTLQAPIVFAGFGVNDPTHDVAHLEGVDLSGKWVMVFQKIPHVVDGDTLITPSVDARARISAIFRNGAEGILLISDMSQEEFEKSAKEAAMSFGELTNMRLAYLDDGSDSRGFSKGYNLVSPEMAAQLLGLGDAAAVESYRKELIQNISDFSPKRLGYTLTQIPYSTETSFESKNVLAFFEGADPMLKDEVIVLTSHYDHVGISRPDSTGDRIYNGADDDGSGTVGLLSVAHAFSEAKENGVMPKRSILFLHVSGEEKGLLGSRYYSDHPVFPIEKTIANLNTDMIGRIDKKHEKMGVEDYVYIIGGEIISSELDSLLQVANAKTGQVKLSKRYNDLQDPNQFYRRSDHWNFGRLGVPFIFFFTGVHEDYHRPSDEVHKIRFDKMAKIIRTIYGTTVLVANTENPPTVDNQEFIEITQVD